jgi:peptidyl-prolyl cis-trans isomerase SurA
VGLTPRPAHAVVVERVVAVIGDRPILLTELRARAKVFLLEIAKKMPPGPQQAAAESQIFKELIERMIDDELEGQAADKAKITVTSVELDKAIGDLAAQQGSTVQDLVRSAQRSGLSEQDYRDELRRQLLEGKMLQLRIGDRLRITEEDLKGMFDRTLREERKRREYHPRWIVLHLPPGSTADALSEREGLAREIAKRVRAGEDFGELARRYSDDSATRQLGGDLDVYAPQGAPQVQSGRRHALAPALDAAVQNLEPGQITEPIQVADALVIVQLVERQPSHYTTYEAAKQEMFLRLRAEKLEKAKRRWLEELKSHTHIDVRL